MRVLLRRHGAGIGDWLLMLQAMKNVNRQRPEVELVVDFTLPPFGRVERTLSPLVRRAFECSDVKWQSWQGEDTTGFDVVIPHVIYDRLGYEPYVDGMVRQISEATGLDIACDRDVVPLYTTTPFLVSTLRRYAVLVSQGKSETRYKDWGIERFEGVGQRLKDLCDLVQVGASGDYLLHGAPYVRFMGLPFDALIAVLRECNVVVCLENCIAVLAAQLRKRAACIYTRRTNAGRLTAPGFVPFYSPSIDDVAAYCQRCF